MSRCTGNDEGLKKPAPRILILTGSFGHGHITAARNLGRAFRAALGTGARVDLLDFFAHAYPVSSRVLQCGHAFAVNSAPALWKQLYRLADTRSAELIPFKTFSQKLSRYLADYRPSAVVSVFPMFSLLMEQLYPDKATRPFPFFTVITDAITINAIWCQGNSDLLFVTDEWSKDALINVGIPGERIRAHGFPLAAPFHLPAETLGDPAKAPLRILYLPTTRTGHVKATLDRLVPWAQEHEASLTLVLGHHRPRLASVMRKAEDAMPEERLTTHEWRDDVPALMKQHHLTLTKAGGATVNEALGAKCPLLLNYVIPGQEEGNLQLVRHYHCGRYVRRTTELPRVLDEVLVEDGAALWKQFRRNLSQLNRHQASERIVGDILAQLDPSTRSA